jgi:hypothetical protein
MENQPQQIGESLGFRPVMEGRFMARNGAGWTHARPYCNKKICFAATDLSFLAHLLHELSEHPQAYFVKFSTRPRDRMYLGRCFFIDQESVGKTWAKYKNHPKVFCNIQDDDFSIAWRKEVREWKAPDYDGIMANP